MADPQKKPLVLIWGPESSGTRLIKELLLANGYDGAPGHQERWGNNPDQFHLPPPEEQAAIPVWRFSYPMGGKLVDANYLLDFIAQAGYEPKVIITVRDMYPQSMSAILNHYGRRQTVASCYKRIFTAINERDLDFWILTYESLTTYGLPVLQSVPFLEITQLGASLKNGNDKYYHTEPARNEQETSGV